MAKATKEIDLAEVLAESLNKQAKDQKVAFFLDNNDSPTNVEGWVSTGASMLDVAISNRPYGGLPVGRITEITGLEQSGKSLVSAHLLAETQKLGGIAVLIDTENAVSREFLEAIGVDTTKLLYVTAETVEQCFEYTETIIEKVRVSSKDRYVTIVVDSVAAASTEKEMEADYGKDGYATDKAIIISKAMRKITNLIGRQKITLVFTNQLRQKMNAMPFSDPWTTSGGKAIAFHASVRLRLKSMGTIKAKENGIVKQSGAWYEYTDIDTGEIIKFQAKDFPSTLENNQEVKEQIYKRICEGTILQYKKDSLDTDNLVTDSEVIGD